MDEQHFQKEQNNDQLPIVDIKDNYHGSYHQGNYSEQNNASMNDNQHMFDVYHSTEEPDTPGSAIGALILGILSILTSCCCGSGIVFAVLGLVLAIIAAKEQECGVGTAGLVCSIVGICLNVIILIYSLWFGALFVFGPA